MNGSPDMDWDGLNRRLAALARVIAGVAPDASGTEQALQERARRLARAPAAEEAGEWLELLAFELGPEVYALETRHVGEVQPLRQLTPLPGTPPAVLGMVDVRGSIQAVLDLRRMFELPVQGLSDRNNLAILQGPDMEFAVLTDRILGIGMLPRARLTPELANLSGIRANYLLGIAPQGWVVLDGAKLLGDPRLVVDQGG